MGRVVFSTEQFKGTKDNSEKQILESLSEDKINALFADVSNFRAVLKILWGGKHQKYVKLVVDC